MLLKIIKISEPVYVHSKLLIIDDRFNAIECKLVGTGDSETEVSKEEIEKIG